MLRAAIVLIVMSFLVIVAANWFVGDGEDAEAIPVVVDNTTIRRTTAGEVVGFRDKNGARSWQGIAFAAPPNGDLRWQAPAAPIPNNELVEALAPGNLCPQFASLLSGAGEDATPGGISGDEDCLYLNVWAPPNAVDLPVMFWIHGGGNTIGHGGSYNGAMLATTRDVVVVTINYRLGFFGWFRHPALQSGDPLNDSGNYGTLDAIAALQWVQDNIAQFGGDPGNVTVFGESAGAFDTLAMMASPLAKDLFHRAIVQSGGFNMDSVATAENFAEAGGATWSSSEILNGLLIADGTASDRAAAKLYQADMSQGQVREYLYNKTPAQFFALLDGGGFGMINVPTMFSDGHVLPAHSTEEIFSSADKHNMVPVILGTNRDEPSLFMVRDPRYVTNWLGFLPRLKDEETYTRLVKYGALAWKERGVDSLAQYMRAAGNPNVYAYRFDWDEEPSQAGFDLSVALGAAHGLEISFAFGDFEGGLGISYIYPNNEAQFALADSMTSYWTQFAYAGNPGSGRNGEQPEWLSWGTNGKTSIILDTPTDQGIFMDEQIVSVESIKAQLLADTFPDPQDQCALYVRSFRDELFIQAEYEALNPSCQAIDPESISRF